MKGHFIATSNLSKSPGSILPDANESMQRLRYLFLQELSVEQLTITLTLWLTSKLSAVNADKPLPEFIRLRASDPIKPNSFRIIKEGGDQSWVEFSIQTHIQNKDIIFWQPAPKAFNRLFWLALHEKDYNKTIIPESEQQALLEHLVSTLKRPPEQQNVQIAHKTVWNNYISHCVQRDAQLNALAKASLITEEKVPYSSSFYIYTTTRHLRHDNYHAFNRYVDRLLAAAYREQVTEFISSKKPHHNADPLINRHPIEPGYFRRQANAIPIVSIKRQVATEVEGICVGTQRRISTDHASFWIQELNKELKHIRPKGRKPDTTAIIKHHNLLTNLIAIHLITYCGCRPTHAISPAKQAVGKSNMCLKDKGKARTIIFPPHIKQSLINYRQHSQYIYTRFHLSHSETEPLLFLLDANGKKAFLTAKSLRRFSVSKCDGHVPYHFRKAFAQSLFEVGCPTHIFNRLMGHSQFGEQFGQVAQFPLDQQQDKAWINQAADYLGSPQEGLC